MMLLSSLSLACNACVSTLTQIHDLTACFVVHGLSEIAGLRVENASATTFLAHLK